jgi:PPM family protein phosphatase
MGTSSQRVDPSATTRRLCMMNAEPTMLNAELTSNPSTGAKAQGVIDAAGATHVGRGRPLNEDAYLIATLQRSMVVYDASPEAARGWLPGGSAGTLLMVADGMGGQGGGDVASRVAVNSVASYLLNVMAWPTAPAGAPAARENPSSPGVRDQLSSALVVGDSTVKTTAANTGTPRMGTTLTMALVLWPDLYVAHVGDTRCYLSRSGQLRRLTTDHTVAQMLANAAEPVHVASQLHHTLWNSLGGSAELPKPEISKVELELGDVLLLCSDGLTKHVTDDEIRALLSTEEPNAARCAKFVDRANAGGGSDNVTIVVATARAASPGSYRPNAPTSTSDGGAPPAVVSNR